MRVERSSAVIYAKAIKLKNAELALAKIAGKPMIEYVLDVLPDEVEDVLIAVENGKNLEEYEEIAEKYFARTAKMKNLRGKVRNFIEFAINSVEGDKLVVLPCDAPLITRDFASFLLECSKKFTATLPRSPSRKALYLMASYRRKPFKEAFNAHPDEDMDDIVKMVGGVLYLSSNSLRIFDEKLGMFFRVSSVQDLRKAEKILKMKKRRS
ncbi:MAG: NTP transferase domain-containing protein [Thaumarchaeota archaeon]|nr:NTP transferase domain-containing protein [Nitrososphaerota archaeon]